ncbi:branched-chain amino acid ABC transporter permease [Streptomyces sp. NPDC056165]|uniref:branched-chain amino acid ABC transporter permease n=1 Tax=Streptomyces sp. NPDC056165 TaxID=3345733 RepID=UPI0035D5701F
MTQILQYVVDTLSLGSLYALYSLGIAVVFGIARLINFAHGELIMIAGFTLLLLDGWPLPLRLAAACVAALIAAVLMERLAFRPVRGAKDDTLLITSFAVSFFLQNLFIVMFGALPQGTLLLPSLGSSFNVFGVSIGKLDAATIMVTFLSLATLTLFLTRSSLGIQMRASAENFRMARCLGVPANRVIATAFAISGLLAAFGAVMMVTRTGLTSPVMGVTPVFAAFVANIIGGLGRLSGAVLGSYLLASLTVAFQALLPVGPRSYRDAFVFGALLLVLVARPNGLLRAVATEQRV